MLTVIPKTLENQDSGLERDAPDRNKHGLSTNSRWHAELIPVSGGYMIRINGWPLYQLGLVVGALTDTLAKPLTQRSELIQRIVEMRPHLQFAANDSYLPVDSKAAAQNLLTYADGIVSAKESELPPLTPIEQGNLIGAIMHLYTILARDLAWFDLYWVEPKLGYSTIDLLRDATVIFPKSIRNSIPERIKYEVQQAANCLLYEASSAVGFHVLRAVELVVLDYFTIPGWDREGAATWTEYARVLKKRNLHAKIRAMVVRLAELHRNELMHAEAVLSPEEAAMLFALMQEILPIMIADIAKRKGVPITSFPILDDPGWQ